MDIRREVSVKGPQRPQERLSPPSGYSEMGSGSQDAHREAERVEEDHRRLLAAGWSGCRHTEDCACPVAVVMADARIWRVTPVEGS